MQKIEMLYNTIHQLSQIEKRNFRLEMTKYKKASNYIKVYDFLNKSQHFPEQSQIDNFTDKEQIPNLGVHIHYIFDKLLHFLVENRTPLGETQIQIQLVQQAKQIKMLRNLGFFKTAQNASLHLLKKADKHGYYQFSINALIALHIYQSFSLKPFTIKLPPINGQNFSIIERIKFYQNQLQLNEVLKLLNTQYVKASILIRSNPTIDIKQLDLAPIPNIEGPILNTKTQALFHQVKIFHFTIYNQYEALKNYLTQLKQEMDKIYFEHQDQIIFHIFLLHAYGGYVLFDQAPSSFPTFARNYKKIILDKSKYINNISPVVLNGLNVISKTLLIEALYLKKNLQPKDIKQIEIENKDIYVGSKVTYFEMLLNLSFLYLIAKDYATSNKYIEKIKQAEAEETKLFLWEIPYISLINSFEDGEVKYVKSQITKLKRKEKNKKKTPAIQRFILTLIQELLNHPKAQHLSIMTTSLPQLIELEQNFLLAHFKYSFWLKDRIGTRNSKK